nr:RecBCD enzyme subunit RecB [Methanosarcinales archaeon ANME-2c ERB4]QNO43192.1 RecBCD enzyme subunit RecB [Methanosarcinales archaeon ANME-2c ERB4]QNO45767.1 RecBCD enzyme subunit RecB [Methanosarcinales archaeon ANME-2c ERB4]
MIDTSDEDIWYAEGIFLPDGKSFDSERIFVIKCMESKDIQACPGSGKTTTLLAKLAILAKKMPLEDNRGICVLAHTNVAIDEIKNKLGSESDILFNYPNYIGTIQSFVDKFLAIPANIVYYGTRPSKIDNEAHDFEMTKKFNEIKRDRDLFWWLKSTSSRKGITPYELFLNIRIDFINGKIKDNINASRALLADSANEKYVKLFSAKEYLFQNGILHYDDAYSLAFKYLNDFGEILSDTLSERFAFVFIDEMQDTDSHQNEIINEIFDKSKVVVQKFGDVNQSIYDSSVKAETVWDVSDDCLNISGSKRFSNRIADIVKRFCVNKQNVSGNSSIEDIQPTILQFDDDTIEFVLPTFAEIISEHNLGDKINKFKAVGWVGAKKENKITLISYFPNFQKKSQLKKSNFNHLGEYLQKSDVENVNYYRKMIINVLLKVLRLLDIKNEMNSRFFTERSLIQYLNMKDSDFYYEFNLKMGEWCLEIHNKNNIFAELKDFIENDFCPFFETTNLNNIKDLLQNDSFLNGESHQFQHSNIYSDASNIDIEVATVHSVKGETHTATLYLETYYNRGFDIKRSIDYLKKNTDGGVYIQSLKMAYVGMTRPTDLLCIAAHKDSISGNEDFLQNMGWAIKNICNNEQPEEGIKSNYQSTLTK